MHSGRKLLDFCLLPAHLYNAVDRAQRTFGNGYALAREILPDPNLAHAFVAMDSGSVGSMFSDIPRSSLFNAPSNLGIYPTEDRLDVDILHWTTGKDNVL
jgi:hypothetical protein